MTDTRLCELVGMTPQNLRATYKKSDNPKKRFMYDALKIGAEILTGEQNGSKKKQ